MKWGLSVLVAICVAGCGADGEPVPPTRDVTVTLSDTGVSAAARVGVTQGPVAVTLGLGF